MLAMTGGALLRLALGLTDGLAEGDVLGLRDGELVGDVVGGAMIVTIFPLVERELASIVTFTKAPTDCFTAFSTIA